MEEAEEVAGATSPMTRVFPIPTSCILIVIMMRAMMRMLMMMVMVRVLPILK